MVAVAGAAQPAIGSMVRARWAAVAPDTDRLRSAFALESIIDELIFSIGPLITAFLAFQLGLPLPLIASAVIGLVGAIALALQRRSEPTPSGRPRDGATAGSRGGALRQPGLLLVVIGAMGIGGVFGSYEVSVVAFTQQAGASGASGVILGLWAFASMLGGIVFGSRQWGLPLAAPGDGPVRRARPRAGARAVRRNGAAPRPDHPSRGRRGRARPSSPTSRSRSDSCPDTC